MPVKFYFDANNNCVYDGGDKNLLLPIKTEIDSNGIPVDTVSSTSGFYYKSFGSVGTIYTFRVISTPAGFHMTCPSSGILYDTVQATVNNYHPKYFGLNCVPGTSFDLVQHVSTKTGRHRQDGTILIENTFCTPQDANVTLHFNSRYHYFSASPSATTYTDSTATWHLTGITSSSTTYPLINYWLEVPGSYSTWLHAGDTVNSSYLTIAATTGDVDTNNNVITKNDTVVSSYDPNEISVTPTGNVLPCTKLQYTIRFENDGNAPARNIYVMDTLSDNMDVKSLNIEIASSMMNVAIINDGVHHIAKFDFPDINLPDSTHHNECEGMLIFNIKTKAGLPDGTTIFNHAGIFFDDNPVVMTNTIENVIGISPVSGPTQLCIGSHIGLYNTTTGGTWSSGTPAVATIGSGSGYVTSLVPGTSVITYTAANTCGSRIVTRTITVNPNPAPIAGLPSICVGATTALIDSGAGTWASSNTSVATVGSTGIVSGVLTDTAVITYLLPSGCKTTKTITVNPLPSPVSGTPAFCSGATATLTDPTTSGSWSSSNIAIASIGSGTGIVTGVGGGTATISYTLATGCSATTTVTVNPPPAIFPISGGGNYCSGDTGVHIGIGGSAVGTNYFLHHSSSVTGSFPGSGSALDFGLQTVTGAYTVSAINTATTCHTNMPDSTLVSTTPSVTPSVTLALSPGNNVCIGTPITFTPTAINGGISPLFQWSVNGTGVFTGGTYTFTPANGDIVKVTLNSDAICANPDTAGSSEIMNIIDPGAVSVTIVATPGLFLNVGEYDTLAAVVTGTGSGLTYQWFINTTPVPGATNSVFITNELFTGDHVKCEVNNAGTCPQSGSAFVTIILNNVGIKMLSGIDGITIFPNPNKGSFTLKGSVGSIPDEEITIEITDMLGQITYKNSLISENGLIDENINLSNNLSVGMYMLSLRSQTGKNVLHFVISK